MTFDIYNQKDREKVKTYIDELPEKRFTAEIKVKREKRTIDQNSLYWLWINCISDETGNSKEELHEFFKAEFLGVSEKTTFGITYFVANSTTKKDTKEFKYYLDRVQQFANVELGITLPDPEDLHWDEFYNHYKNYI